MALNRTKFTVRSHDQARRSCYHLEQDMICGSRIEGS